MNLIKKELGKMAFLLCLIFSLILILFIYNTKRNNKINFEIKNIANKIVLRDTREINEENLDVLENKLELKKRYSEMYFIRGCRDIINMDTESAKENLELSKLEFSNTDYDLIKLYTSKLLTQIYVQDKEYEKAIEIVNEGFGYIDKKSYNRNNKEIWELVRLIVEIPGGRELAINILNKILDDSINLSNDTQLNINRRLKGLYLTSDNYAKASESILKTIDLSQKLDEKYIKLESKVELGILFNRFGKVDYAISSINSALEEKLDDINEQVLINVYVYINLSEIYLDMNNYEKAKEYSMEIKKYKVYFNEEDYRDIEILKNIIDAEIYIKEGKLNEAKEKLDHSKKLLLKDINVFLKDKEFAYDIADARLSKANGDYDIAIKVLEKALKDSIEKDNMYNRKKIIEMVIKMAEDEGDIKREEEYSKYLSQWHTNNETSIYSDYTYYIFESIDKNNILESEKQKKVIAYRVLLGGIIIFYITCRIIYIKIKKMKYIVSSDGLTGVYNRLKFDKDYKILLEKKIKFSVIMIDVDNFKGINDKYGHGFGDLVLVNICRVIKGMLYDECNIYRYGGEEFIILLKYKIKPETIILAENIRKSVKKIIWEDGFNTTISLGIATSEDELENVVEEADKNLYKAKKAGKDKIFFRI